MLYNVLFSTEYKNSILDEQFVGAGSIYKIFEMIFIC
jgi:hypothetical protein